MGKKKDDESFPYSQLIYKSQSYFLSPDHKLVPYPLMGRLKTSQCLRLQVELETGKTDNTIVLPQCVISL